MMKEEEAKARLRSNIDSDSRHSINADSVDVVKELDESESLVIEDSKSKSNFSSSVNDSQRNGMFIQSTDSRNNRSTFGNQDRKTFYAD